MNQIKNIREQIIQDQDNQSFSKQGWQPIFQEHEDAKILIIGQAPGIKTQGQGRSFKDKSGDKLREWMGIDEDVFYNSHLIAVLPLDFYFPGKAKTGDLPPRKGFASKWHPLLIEAMPKVELTLLIGTYAQKEYLKKTAKQNLTQTVLAYEEYLPKYFPLVHPSPLNFRWFNKNPEFESNIVPVLKAMVQTILFKK